jgi:hypothetical protein
MAGHLIHVGFPKAGSTFLQQWFNAHPQIAYAKGGIAGLTGVEAVVEAALSPAPELWRVTSAEALTAPLVSSAAAASHRAAVAPTAFSDLQKRVCALLAALFCGATILIVTRGFRSMILSSYSQYVRTGGTDSLRDMIAAALVHQPWDYDAVIRSYEEAFGAEKVIVLPYEWLAAEPAAFLGEVERRMGLDAAPSALDRVNASLTPAELAWYPWLGRASARLPLGRRTAVRLVAKAASSNRLKGPISLLQALRPRCLVNEAMISQDVLDGFAGRAELLRGRPHYGAYADAYLL